MANLGNEVTEKLGSLAGKWTSYAAFGSFLLYLFGYLALRFQLTTFGVATNLDLFDEKYFFAGCRFLVYLVSSIPNTLILVLILAAPVYLFYRLFRIQIWERFRHWISDWSAHPLRLPLLGIVLAVALIQFALRKCFAFANLLLRKQPPDEWIGSVLLTSDERLSLYFSGLMAGIFLTGAILLFTLRRGTATTSASKWLVALLVFLFAVQLLLLPANYGVLISTQQLPRVTEVSGEEKLSNGQRSWLLWDSKDALIYFVRSPDDQRMLITVPRKDSKIRIVGYDDIFCVLFGGNQVETRPCPR